MDAESEKQVQSAINNVAKGRTTLIIAHRLSTIRNADIIGVMLHGKLVEVQCFHLLLSLKEKSSFRILDGHTCGVNQEEEWRLC